MFLVNYIKFNYRTIPSDVGRQTRVPRHQRVCALNAPRYAMLVTWYLNVRRWMLSEWSMPACLLSQVPLC